LERILGGKVVPLMSNFSDREDRHLVQLALVFEERGKHVVWKEVVQCMRYSKKNAHMLRTRLKTLKSTHGKSLKAFPRWFFLPPTQAQQINRTTAHPMPPRTLSLPPSGRASSSSSSPLPSSTRTIALAGTDARPTRTGGQKQSIPEGSVASAPTPMALVAAHSSDQQLIIHNARSLTSNQAHTAVHEIFKGVRRSDVRQAAGQTETNTGEMSVLGVTALIRICQLSEYDVFLDVGSGIGNVVVQVVLESSVKLAVGVEIRREVAALSQEILRSALHLFPQLGRALVPECDVRMLQDQPSEIMPATVLFASNLLFAPAANHSLHRLCCELPYLRLVVLIDQVCPRHKPRCKSTFCSMWTLRPETTLVTTEFRSAPMRLYVYDKA
jgi:hypothetical protein